MCSGLLNVLTGIFSTPKAPKQVVAPPPAPVQASKLKLEQSSQTNESSALAGIDGIDTKARGLSALRISRTSGSVNKGQ